jgi:hypothetical protein
MKKIFIAIRRCITALLLLFLVASGKAQEQPLAFLVGKMESYRDKTLQEKLFLHTDKKTYLAGEFLWFKAYCVEGYTHQPLHLSRLAYVELLNNSNKAVLQTKISLKAGEDNGSLYLPLNLPTGNYKLRAYTNWMKNFSADFFFEKVISVINPLSNSREQTKGEAEDNYQVSFFPEGGYLVNGLTSTLAFKATDQYGRGVPFKGWIVNEKNDTITNFSPLKFGMGRIAFTPLNGHRYSAVVLFADGKEMVKGLPQPLEQGYVMHLSASSGKIRIEVKANGDNNGDLFLLAHTREVIKVTEEERLHNGSIEFVLDAARFDPGITQFTLFDAARRPVAERLYFTRPTVAAKAGVQMDKQQYGRREKINLTLRDVEGRPAKANLSLSVFRVDSIQTPDETNIANYLLLTSDLAGKVESPEYYLGESKPEQDRATDNLMLTQGWRRFRWQNVLDDKEGFTAVYPPEVNGPLVTGNVYKIATGERVAGLPTYLALPNKQYQVYFAQSNAKGQVQFELKDYFGSGEMVVRPYSADDSLYRIELQNQYAEQYTSQPLAPLTFAATNPNLLTNYSVGMQVRQVYAGDSLNQFSAPQRTDTFSFIGVPDYTYNLDDYTRFTTMEEVLREYVRPINVGSRQGKPHMVFVDEATHTPYDENLLVMLDGVPLYRGDRIFQYDPLKVKKLEIYPRGYVMGPYYFLGVASFSTYKGQFDAHELDPHLISFDYSGLQMQREFYAPTYETAERKESRVPDYRNTLYWNPNIQLTANGTTSVSFYSCDQKGRYLGVLQGLDDKGNPIAQEFQFEVK